MKKFTTADCKEFIVNHRNEESMFTEHQTSDWKRTKKYKNENGEVVREFQNKNNEYFYIVERDGRLEVYDNISNTSNFETLDKFKQRLKDAYDVTCEDDLYPAIYEMMDDNNKLKKDLDRVTSDYENVGDYLYGTGFRVLDCGVPALIFAHGGDWEAPMYDVIFWDGNDWRGYVPEEGNFYNKDTSEAYGNDYNGINDLTAAKKEYAKFLPCENLDSFTNAEDLIETLSNNVPEETLFKLLIDDTNKYIANLLNIPLIKNTVCTTELTM